MEDAVRISRNRTGLTWAIWSGAVVRHGTPYLSRALVLPETLIDHLAKQVVVGPSQVFDFGHKLKANPMHAAEHER